MIIFVFSLTYFSAARRRQPSASNAMDGMAPAQREPWDATRAILLKQWRCAAVPAERADPRASLAPSHPSQSPNLHQGSHLGLGKADTSQPLSTVYQPVLGRRGSRTLSGSGFVIHAPQVHFPFHRRPFFAVRARTGCCHENPPSEWSSCWPSWPGTGSAPTPSRTVQAVTPGQGGAPAGSRIAH